MKYFVGLLLLLAVTSFAAAEEEEEVGGFEDVDVDDDDVQYLSLFAAEHISMGTNSMYHQSLERVLNASRQLVRGWNYRFTLELATTICRKNKIPYEYVDACDLNDKEPHRLFSVELYYRSWTDTKEVTSFHEIQQSEPFTEFDLFNNFISTHQKQYTKEEYARRFQIFKINLDTIRRLNQVELGTAQYGITEFSDLTYDEFRKYTGFRKELATHQDARAEIPRGPAPASFDWRTHNVVSDVKNQGQCGSCWAFSTTGNIEGQWAIKKKQLVSLSEQELVDCDKLDQGCNGGLPSNAYKEIIRLGGLTGETTYPYTGEDGTCQYKPAEEKVYINSSVAISQNETDMAAWLAQNGPISIGINALPMQFYFGGISHPWKIFCNPANLDHGVLIVGYGVENSTPFWIIKNSWGASWGESGYYRIYRGDGSCGLNRMATSAVIN